MSDSACRIPHLDGMSIFNCPCNMTLICLASGFLDKVHRWKVFAILVFEECREVLPLISVTLVLELSSGMSENCKDSPALQLLTSWPLKLYQGESCACLTPRHRQTRLGHLEGTQIDSSRLSLLPTRWRPFFH